MRTHAEWNVLTQIALATGPTRSATRWRISSAALLVNVIARIAVGDTPSSMRWAMRWVSTLVLPEPAPATTRSGVAAMHDGVELIGVERVQVERVGHGPSSVRTGCDTEEITPARVEPARPRPYGGSRPHCPDCPTR